MTNDYISHFHRKDINNNDIVQDVGEQDTGSRRKQELGDYVSEV